MTEQRVLGGDHNVGIGGLIEVPAIAVATDLEDADLLEVLKTPHPGGRVGVELRRAPSMTIGTPGGYATSASSGTRTVWFIVTSPRPP